MKLNAKNICHLCGIFLISGILILPMYLNGVPNGRDFPQHFQFAETYYNAISAGDFFPGWAAADNYGFGSIGIRFYPPAAYYVAAFARTLAGDWYNAILLAFLFWMFVGSAGIYFWTREIVSSRAAVAAAVLYAFAPYHLSQIYQTWFYAEFAAAGILPFCFLFLTRICRRGTSPDVLLFAVSYSLLILTHIPSTITASIGLAIYGLFLTDWRRHRKTFLKFFVAFALSVSATAFHWLKIVTEINWVRHSDAQYSTGYYDYQQYFFPMFYSAGDKYWERFLWHFDVSTILTFLLLLPLIALLILQVKTETSETSETSERRFFLALSAVGIFSLFMMSVPSVFLWELVPLLQKIQFPWRWLSVSSVVSVTAFCVALPQLFSSYEYVKKVGLYAVLFLMAAILVFDFTQNIVQSEPMSEEEFAGKLAETRAEPGCPCWWTMWAKPEAFNRKEKVSAVRQIKIAEWKDESREFEVEAGEPSNARVATFYYPHWQAQINGQPTAIQKDDDGSILIFVPSEKSSVKIYFQEPAFLKIARIVSLLVWLFLTGALILTRRTEKIQNL